MKIQLLYGFLYLTIIINTPITHATDNPENFLGPRDISGIKSSIENYFKQADSDFQYGNWYRSVVITDSPDTRRSGNKIPVDSLDYIAQKHDFAYQIAEQQGKLNGMAEEKRLKGIADYLMIRDAKMLPDNPKQWSKPPSDIHKAARYRDRMIAGFTEQAVTESILSIMDTSPNWATAPIENLKLEKSRQLNADDFENLVTHLQNTWNGEDSAASSTTNNSKPVATDDDNTNKTAEQKSASNKKTDIVPKASTELKETNPQKLEITNNYVQTITSEYSADFPGNSLVYYIKSLAFRISALCEPMETKSGKKFAVWNIYGKKSSRFL